MAEFGSFDSTGGGAIVVSYMVEGAPEAAAKIESVTAAQDEQAVSSERLSKAQDRNAVSSKRAGLASRAFGKGLDFTRKMLKLTTLGLGISAVALGISSFHFEQQMANTAAITKAQGKGLKELEYAAFAASERTQYNATAAAKAEMLLGRASFNRQQILKTLTPTLNLATAAQGNLSDTAVLMGETMKAFDIPARNAAHVSDVLASATQNGAISMDDLIQAMKYVGAAAYGSHQNLDQLVALMKLMALHGVKGSIAGTTLRYALTRLVKPVKQVQDGLALINVHAADLYGKKGLKPLPTILDTMYKSMKGIGDVAKNKVLVDVFGVRALSGMSALFNQGPVAWHKAIEAMRNSDGLAAKIAAKMRNTVPVQFDILAHGFENLAALIYLQFQPRILKSLKTLNGYFQPVIKHLGQLQDMVGKGEWKGAIYYVDSLTNSHGHLSAILFTVIDFIIQLWGNLKIAYQVIKPFVKLGIIAAYLAFKLLTKFMGFVNHNSKIMIPVLKTLLGVWLAATLAVKLLALAQWAWNLAMDANPIVLLVYAIALLALGLYEAYVHIGWFHRAVDAVWHFISSHWRLLADIILGPIIEPVLLILKYWGTLQTFFVGFYDRMKSVGKTMWDWIKQPLHDIIEGAKWEIKQFIKGIKKIVDEYNNIVHGSKQTQAQNKYGGYVDKSGRKHLALPGGVTMFGEKEGAQAPPVATASSSQSDNPPQKVEPWSQPQDPGEREIAAIIHNHIFLDGKQIAESQSKVKSDKRARGKGSNATQNVFGLAGGTP